MKRSAIFSFVAFFLALTAAGAFAFYSLAAPTALRIAVGPVGSEDTKLVVAILQTFAREKHPVRLRLVPTDGPTGSAEALSNGKVDLAIVRSDGNMPTNAATVAIMHRDVALILATPGRGVVTLADLQGKRVGIVRGFSLNQKLLNFVLERNGIRPETVTKVNLRSIDVRAAVAEDKVDAIFSLAPVTSNLLSLVMQDMTSEKGAAPAIIPISDAEALAQRNPVLEYFNLLRGSFGSSPPRPSENVETLAVTHRLVADRGIKDSTIADLTKSLLEVRQAVAVDAPMGARIEAPNTEANGPLVIHPGAAAYIDGEQQSFIEKYGEWIYIGVMGVSLLGSLGAALLSRTTGHGKPAGSSDLDRMLMILRRTRAAGTLDALDGLQKEADDSFARIVERAANSEIDEPVLGAFTIALGEVRSAIEDRRRVLTHDEVAALAE